ncbi:hypothetical protein BDN72DRAFT_343854 [Pluteus cervinus]|uniref:Uncharacterized protein n=1 Tax=Pluteus cervinus TaxID=181527 RepID=A0ACD3B3U4_9AGAR|nr:hypothetical protein BDN72DRAFT_343854 [Pluteus cervinus]
MLPSVVNVLLILSGVAHASLFGGLTEHLLLGRQSLTNGSQGIPMSAVPSECTADCADFITYTQTCAKTHGTAAHLCGCSLSTENDIVQCFNCLVTIDQPLIQLAQNLLDQYIDTCNAAGGYVPVTTVEGGKSEATSIHQGGGAVSNSVPPSPLTTAPPAPSSGSGSSAGNNTKGGFQKGDGFLDANPRTLLWIVLCIASISASFIL